MRYKEISKINVENWVSILENKIDELDFVEKVVPEIKLKNQVIDGELKEVFSKGILFYDNETQPKDFELWEIQKLFDLIQPILEEQFGEGKITKTSLIEIPADDEIHQQKVFDEDNEEFFRFHIPLKTHVDVFYICNGIEKNFKVGKFYQVYQCLFHAIDNISDEPVYHIIIDYRQNK